MRTCVVHAGGVCAKIGSVTPGVEWVSYWNWVLWWARCIPGLRFLQGQLHLVLFVRGGGGCFVAGHFEGDCPLDLAL